MINYKSIFQFPSLSMRQLPGSNQILGTKTWSQESELKPRRTQQPVKCLSSQGRGEHKHAGIRNHSRKNVWKHRTHPVTTDRRNLVALSTTSSHTEDTVLSSKREASGRARRASRDSCNSSLQRSASSPGQTEHISRGGPPAWVRSCQPSLHTKSYHGCLRLNFCKTNF